MNVDTMTTAQAKANMRAAFSAYFSKLVPRPGDDVLLLLVAAAERCPDRALRSSSALWEWLGKHEPQAVAAYCATLPELTLDEDGNFVNARTP